MLAGEGTRSQRQEDLSSSGPRVLLCADQKHQKMPPGPPVFCCVLDSFSIPATLQIAMIYATQKHWSTRDAVKNKAKYNGTSTGYALKFAWYVNLKCKKLFSTE